ncbi:hypothetical protein [Salinilacihabitans rarus]|nr:hypothetical protein [Salinilacihabitans rarus]
MRASTILVGLGALLIVVPIPVLPPLVGTAVGIGLVVLGLFLRLFGL